MKILLAGEWQAEIHEQAWSRGLQALGHSVVPFGWYEDLLAQSPLKRLLMRAQMRVLAGPGLNRLNRRLLVVALEERPDVLLLYRCFPIFARTLEEIRRHLPRTLIVSYNNDDPFSTHARRGLWRHYLAALEWTDVNFVYRERNALDLDRLGARDVHLVRSGFLPWRDQPQELSAADHDRFDCDVVFAGHYEADGRTEFLRIVESSPWRFKLFGPGWESAKPAPWLERLQPVAAIVGTDYVKAIQCSRIALCFLSGLNNDGYTRRCFEIPAIGAMLLCQRSSEMETLLEPETEAAYFSTAPELLAKLGSYLEDEPARARIAQRGFAKVRAAGHDVVSRMRFVESVLREALVRREALLRA